MSYFCCYKYLLFIFNNPIKKRNLFTKAKIHTNYIDMFYIQQPMQSPMNKQNSNYYSLECSGNLFLKLGAVSLQETCFFLETITNKS